jgi:hypothetical protein
MPFAIPLGKLASAIGIKGFIVIGMALALAVCWWGWTRAADARDEAEADLRAAEAEIALLQHQAALVETAAEERAADTDTLRTQDRELSDARNHEGDDADTRRVRRLCVVMRQQGRDTSGLAACQRFAGEGGT